MERNTRSFGNCLISQLGCLTRRSPCCSRLYTQTVDYSSQTAIKLATAHHSIVKAKMDSVYLHISLPLSCERSWIPTRPAPFGSDCQHCEFRTSESVSALQMCTVVYPGKHGTGRQAPLGKRASICAAPRAMRSYPATFSMTMSLEYGILSFVYLRIRFVLKGTSNSNKGMCLSLLRASFVNLASFHVCFTISTLHRWPAQAHCRTGGNHALGQRKPLEGDMRCASYHPSSCPNFYTTRITKIRT
jgi:hypothetical protein